MSRDYKDEYKKFQSSDKMKKKRAELNAYNRKKGTYGNGDGKDASHKNGEITGFVEKVVGTVVCKEAHKLQANDRVSLSVTPGITTSFDIQFDDTTRRTFVNPISFGASAVESLNVMSGIALLIKVNCSPSPTSI